MSKMFEVRAIVPDLKKEMLKAKNMRAYILNEEKAVAKMVQKDLYKTTQYWKHQVTFNYRLHYAGGNVYMEIGPVASQRGARIWRYVNDGTAMIPFRFNPKYRAKTKYPGSIGTNVPGEFTRPSQKIAGPGMTPGIRPRLWTEILIREYSPILVEAIQFAIKRGLGEI